MHIDSTPSTTVGRLLPLASAIALAVPILFAPSAFAEKSPAQAVENVYVYGEQGETDTATKLDLTILETPQTVTAVSRVQLDDFALNSINDVLDYTPGVTVEEVETDRTYYTARGFDIVNFQYDGVGVPFTVGNNNGQQDTAIFERVDVVKGAAGLVTGLANPSATVNFVRKRPTKELQASGSASVNEWNGVRVDGDIAGAVSDRVRARLVLARDDSDSYLDRHEDQRDVFYGIVETDLSDSTLLTVGHSYDNSESDAVLWGALPLLYSDGTQTDYDVSTSTAPDWTFANSERNQTFVELKQYLSERWALNAIYTRNDYKYESRLFYVYGAPNSPADESGLGAQGSDYNSDEEQNIYDLYVSGDFTFAGRDHQLVVGLNYADIQTDAASYYDNENGYPTELGPDWAKGNYPEPTFDDHDPATETTDIKQTHKAVYLSSRLNVTDALSVLLGVRRAELTQEGQSYGGPSDTDAEETVPYYGVTYQVANDVMVYSSYSEVFKQQTFVNDQFQPLGATMGENTEVGVKKSFNNDRAILTLAVFQSEHDNLGEFVGRDPDTGTAFYAGRQFEADGYELEFAGEVTEGFNLSAGYTKVNIEDDQGNDVRPFVPEQLVKLSASYRVPALPALKIGGVVKWQDSIETAGNAVEQDAYTVMDLAVQYAVTENVSVGVNMKNVTDEKYLNSLYWDQAYYGAPRNVQASITWQY